MSAPTVLNETSFAKAYRQASTLVVESLAQIGASRRALLSGARELLDDAQKYADLFEERVLADQLKATIKLYEQRGLDR